jgi:signal transduction histidine kinase
MHLSFVHSLKTKLVAGILAALAMTLAMAGVLSFGARTLERNARLTGAADYEVRDLLGLALVTHRYMSAFGHSLGQRTLVANNERRVAAAAFETRMRSMPIGGGRHDGASLDWDLLRAISKDLRRELQAADELRASGQFYEAERMFNRAEKLQFEQRMLPWFESAIEVQRAQAERLEHDAIMHARALRSWGTLLATGMASLAALVLWATLRALLSPVRLLVAGTAAIARGDFSHRIRYRSRNELGLLALRFDDMAEVVEHSQKSLLEKNHALERAYQLQGEFLSMMSHELRSPLHSILGYTELVLEDTEALPTIARRNIESIATGARRLLALINDILDFSKLKAGRMQLRTERFLPSELAQEAVNDARVLAQARAIDVELEVEVGAFEMMSDQTKVRQILTNLLSNAVKFCDRGRVTLRVERNGADHVVFRVRDTGVGIAADQFGEIFEPFRQVQGLDRRAESGTGLGLAIVWRLSELLGGSVSVQSTLGEGSEFAVCLPIQVGSHGKNTDH